MSGRDDDSIPRDVLRDLIALVAMHAIVSDPNVTHIEGAFGFLEKGPRQCYLIADAMLVERERK